VRIGGDPGCHVHVPGLAAQVATLRYSDKSWRVINRSDGPLELEGRPLEAGGQAPWKSGQRLKLAPRVVLALRLDPDPAPKRPAVVAPSAVLEEPEPEPPPPEDPDAPPPEPAPPPKKPAKSNLMPSIVIALCVVGGAWVMLDEGGPDAETGAKQRAEFEDLLKQLNERVVKEPQNRFYATLLDTLQSARINERRDDYPGSGRAYRMLHDLLESRRRDLAADDPAAFDSELDFRVYRFVSYQLKTRPELGQSAEGTGGF
jgi:hypothetical protein